MKGVASIGRSASSVDSIARIWTSKPRTIKTRTPRAVKPAKTRKTPKPPRTTTKTWTMPIRRLKGGETTGGSGSTRSGKNGANVRPISISAREQILRDLTSATKGDARVAETLF